LNFLTPAAVENGMQDLSRTRLTERLHSLDADYPFPSTGW